MLQRPKNMSTFVRGLRLKENDRNKPLSYLHLRPYAIRVLARMGIWTIGDLMEAPLKPIMRKFSRLTLGRRQINQAFIALDQSISSSGEIDWVKYARQRGYPILPQKPQQWSPRTLIRELPSVAEKAVAIRLGDNAVVILKRQLLAPKGVENTLEECGRAVGLTKERVRQVLKDITRLLHGIVQDNNYSGCEFYIRGEFLDKLRALSKAMHHERWSTVSYAQWESVLRRCWKTPAKDICHVESLILAMLGFRLLRFKTKFVIRR